MNRDSTLKLAGKHGRVPSASSRNYENTRSIVNPMEVVSNEYGSIANMPVMKSNYMLNSKIITEGTKNKNTGAIVKINPGIINSNPSLINQRNDSLA